MNAPHALPRRWKNAAPHWLEEARAQAQAAAAEAWQLLALNCLPPDFWGKNYIPAPA
jgi:hypothetical protein